MTDEEYQRLLKEYPKYRVDLARALDDLKTAVIESIVATLRRIGISV